MAGKGSGYKKGQRVEFFRSHDKQHKLTGTVVDVDDENNLVEIETDATNGSVSRVENVHPGDVVKVLESGENGKEKGQDQA